jgi:hypothetical protein
MELARDKCWQSSRDVQCTTEVSSEMAMDTEEDSFERALDELLASCFAVTNPLLPIYLRLMLHKRECFECYCWLR